MPATTRSSAASKSRREQRASRCSRPAKIAASLQMLARSAPVRPLVWRAISSRSTSSASGLSRVCTLRMSAAALEVGRRDEDLAVEAARAAAAPGRASRAGSRPRSRRRCRAPPKPSSSTSSWLSVWSFSPEMSLPRVAPTASSSSMKMIAGRGLARLAEQPPDARRAEAGEHLDERGGRLREEAWRSTRWPRPWRAASCRYRAGRAAGCPWAPSRRACGSASGRAGTPRPRAARPSPPRRPPRRPS